MSSYTNRKKIEYDYMNNYFHSNSTNLNSSNFKSTNLNMPFIWNFTDKNGKFYEMELDKKEICRLNNKDVYNQYFGPYMNFYRLSFYTEPNNVMHSSKNYCYFNIATENYGIIFGMLNNINISSSDTNGNIYPPILPIDITQIKLCGTIANPVEETVLTNNKILKAVSYSEKLWPQGSIIKVKFLEKPKEFSKFSSGTDVHPDFIDPIQISFYANKYYKGDILKCIEEIIRKRIEPITNLKFLFYGPDYGSKTDIRISFDITKGCFSCVGIDAIKYPQSRRTMNFGWFDVATCIHEFLHAIGILHEHQSPYLIDPKFGLVSLNWNLPLLYEWGFKTVQMTREEVDKQIVKVYDKKDISGTEFDEDSIMLYYFPPGIIFSDGFEKGKKKNLILSKTDVKYLYSLYSSPYDGAGIPIPLPRKTPKEFYCEEYHMDIDTGERCIPNTY